MPINFKFQGTAALALLFLLPSAVGADDFDPLAREGVTHYNREEFDQAASKFEASRTEHPENPEVTYNLGNSQYRLGRYEEAVDAFKKALTNQTDPALQQKTYYNMGNAYYRMGYLEEAIDSYKQSLKLKPTDLESKFNLEWTRKQLESARNSGRIGPRDKNILQQQATSDRPNNPPDPGDSKGKGKSRDPTEQPKPEQENEKTAQQDQPSKESKSPSRKNSPSAPGDQHPGPDQSVRDALTESAQMTPEEAERWLGSISEDLKTITRRQMEGNVTDSFADHDKNW